MERSIQGDDTMVTASRERTIPLISDTLLPIIPLTIISQRIIQGKCSCVRRIWILGRGSLCGCCSVRCLHLNSGSNTGGISIRLGSSCRTRGIGARLHSSGTIGSTSLGCSSCTLSGAILEGSSCHEVQRSTHCHYEQK